MEKNEGEGRQSKSCSKLQLCKKWAQNATVTAADIMEALNDLHRRVKELTKVCYVTGDGGEGVEVGGSWERKDKRKRSEWGCGG